jgi:hypothetical protein
MGGSIAYRTTNRSLNIISLTFNGHGHTVIKFVVNNFMGILNPWNLPLLSFEVFKFMARVKI